MSTETDGGSEVNRAKLYRRGPIECGSVERRRLLEELGLEDEVTFVGDADSAGRQAEEGDHLEDSDEEGTDTQADVDPFEEAYLNE